MKRVAAATTGLAVLSTAVALGVMPANAAVNASSGHRFVVTATSCSASHPPAPDKWFVRRSRAEQAFGNSVKAAERSRGTYDQVTLRRANGDLLASEIFRCPAAAQ